MPHTSYDAQNDVDFIMFINALMILDIDTHLYFINPFYLKSIKKYRNMSYCHTIETI